MQSSSVCGLGFEGSWVGEREAGFAAFGGSPEQSGARIPQWLLLYCNDYKAHAADGTPNYVLINGNMAGCADAG